MMAFTPPREALIEVSILVCSRAGPARCTRPWEGALIDLGPESLIDHRLLGHGGACRDSCPAIFFQNEPLPARLNMLLASNFRVIQANILNKIQNEPLVGL
jgi:hypothetical protein